MAKQIAVHRSNARIILVYGSNQSGKSQAAAAQTAYTVLSCHPYRTDIRKYDGKFYAVGWDEKHIGDMMYPRLFNPGSFDIIRDEFTREWRPYNPNNQYDAAYKEKCRPAAPFIPPRRIKQINWSSRKDSIPHSVTLDTGWKMFFYSSRGRPQKGTQIDGWWFDEDIESNLWLPEVQARSMKNAAVGWWSATPECSTPQLWDLHKKCGHPENNGSLFEIKLLLDENPYITQASKDAFKATLSADMIKIKYYGEFAAGGLLVYPEFSPSLHSVKSFPIPPEWSRYMIVDPGVQVCGVLFVAVPPDEKEVHVFKELYIRRCSAKRFAEEVKKEMGQYSRSFEAFLIDWHAARQTGTIGQTTGEIYSEALREAGVESVQTGHGFLPGSDNIPAREESFRRWLEINPTSGSPYLRIHDSCTTLMWEIEGQFYRKIGNVPSDKKRVDKDNHLVDCIEYAAAYDPDYRRPAPPQGDDTYVERLIAAFRRTLHKKPQDSYISLGPSS